MYVRKTDKGRWRYAESYADPLTGRKREVSVTLDKNTTAARKEAARILQLKIAAKNSSGGSSNMTLSELVDKFIRHQYAMRKESTALQDDMTLRPVVRLIGPDARTHRITADTIRSALERSGNTPTWKNQKIKHIKAMWRWAYKEGYVDSMTTVDRLERYPEESARHKVVGKYMESDELKEVIASMESNADYQLFTRFLALSGCRIGEALALTRKDVDMDTCGITIDKTYALNIRKVQSTKTEMSERIVHMRPELKELMRTILRRQRQTCMVYGIRTDLLFPWSDGGYFHYETYSKYFREHTAKILGHPLPVHSLRHTYTSLMAEANIPIEVISRTLGHADSRITREIYMHVTDKIRQADNEKLDAVKIL